MPGTCSHGRSVTSSRRIPSLLRGPHGRLYVCNRRSFPRTTILDAPSSSRSATRKQLLPSKREKEISPNSTMADLGLGKVYLAQGDYEQAVATLTKSAVSAAINCFF